MEIVTINYHKNNNENINLIGILIKSNSNPVKEINNPKVKIIHMMKKIKLNLLNIIHIKKIKVKSQQLKFQNKIILIKKNLSLMQI